ncbi:hypothetical protein BC937DRAFT_95451 [Endogone sp. FLAS-F59071]|nr:hypothetical protein BC937DRAFT_95451 [Endogone sp. FLAS-F59071]|eukprot:RUS22887.1 hypothetical protein BC937DRAFT_95451 [Endogone sp. FLAS-F59071]
MQSKSWVLKDPVTSTIKTNTHAEPVLRSAGLFSLPFSLYTRHSGPRHRALSHSASSIRNRKYTIPPENTTKRKSDMSNLDNRPLLSSADAEDYDNEVGTTHDSEGAPEANRYRAPIFLQPGKFTSLEKLMFFVSAVLLVLMCVFAGLYAKSLSHDARPPGNGDKERPPPPPEVPESTCVAPECIITAANILRDMDLNADPCEDFYGYTCGGWIDSHVIPSDKSSVGVFNDLDDANKKVLRQILEGEWHTPKRPQNMTADLPDPDEIVDQQNFGKLKDFYEACLNEAVIDDLGAKPLIPILNEIVRLFPLKANKYDATAAAAAPHQPWSSNLTNVLSFLAGYNVNPFFAMYVDADAKNPEVNTLYLTQSGLGLPSKEYYFEEDVAKVYASVVSELMGIILNDEKNRIAIFGVDGDVQPVAAEPASPSDGLVEDKMVFIARRIVDFEKEVARYSKTNEELFDPTKSYNPLTISALSNLAPNFIWSTLLDTLVPPENERPKKIISSAPDYIRLLSSSIIAAKEPSTIRYYILWQTILAFAPELGETYRRPLQRLKAKLSGVDPKSAPPRWETCLTKVDSGLGQLAGRFYVLEKFGGDAKTRADDFIQSIKEAFLERLPELEWVDDVTRKRAIEKVDALIQKVGYATSTPNILSPISLAEYYESLTVFRDDHFENQLSANKWAVRGMWNKLGKPVDRGEWLMTPQTVNAYYNPTSNEVRAGAFLLLRIVFPAGILQRPFFGSTDPEYLNYGGIGVVVGHELTHGFDNNGRQFDSHGRLTQWWTNATVEAFESRAQCFVNQYSNFTVPDPRGGSGIHVNGQLTLGENLADNGGLREAYSAWEKRFKEGGRNNVLLAGLEKLGREQLFYVNFGRIWCNRMRPESSVERIRTDPHSPARWRVNGAVQNSRHFAETFNCSAGSAMNPETKCELW